MNNFDIPYSIIHTNSYEIKFNSYFWFISCTKKMKKIIHKASFILDYTYNWIECYSNRVLLYWSQINSYGKY